MKFFRFLLFPLKRSIREFKIAMYLVLASFFVYFFSWFAVYSLGINDLAIQSEDTIPAMFIPVTLINQHTLYADDYYNMIISKYPHPDDKSYQRGLIPFYFRSVQTSETTHYISAFPIMSGLLALPVYFVPIKMGMSIQWENLIYLSHISASLIAASSVGVLFLLLKRHFSLEEKNAILLSLIYAFCTLNFALISQSLWQHGTVELFTLLALYYLYRKWYSLSGFFFAFAVLSRPTAFLLFPFLILIIVGKNHNKIFAFVRQLVSQTRFLVGMLPPILFFIWYNNKFYQSISNQGYSNQLLVNWLSRFPEGFLGLWLSPSKGILIYSPVFIFIFFSIYIILKNRSWNKDFDYIILFCALILHTVVLGKWKHWYGGYSFGYRMASDMIPIMILLLVPYLKSELFMKTKKLFYFAVGFSGIVQLFGIAFFDGVWHAAYDKGFVNTKWLWSIKDSEFVFNVRRILVKLGILNTACPKCLPLPK